MRFLQRDHFLPKWKTAFLLGNCTIGNLKRFLRFTLIQGILWATKTACMDFACFFYSRQHDNHFKRTFSHFLLGMNWNSGTFYILINIPASPKTVSSFKFNNTNLWVCEKDIMNHITRVKLRGIKTYCRLSSLSIPKSQFPFCFLCCVHEGSLQERWCPGTWYSFQEKHVVSLPVTRINQCHYQICQGKKVPDYSFFVARGRT